MVFSAVEEMRGPVKLKRGSAGVTLAWQVLLKPSCTRFDLFYNQNLTNSDTSDCKEQRKGE